MRWLFFWGELDAKVKKYIVIQSYIFGGNGMKYRHSSFSENELPSILTTTKHNALQLYIFPGVAIIVCLWERGYGGVLFLLRLSLPFPK